MASIKKSSFQKRNQDGRNVIKGTKPSLYNSQLLISSGISSLDALLGGGIPVGSLMLINEDEYEIFAKFFLKYFLAEGVVSNHSCLIVSQNCDPEKMAKQLPSPVDSEIEDENRLEMMHKMSIAWRYENLKTVPSSFQNHTYFGHYFDLSKNLSEEVLKKSDIAYWSGLSELSDRSGKSFETSHYYFLLKFIEKKLKSEKYFANEKTSERNILRIVLHHLDSPLWQTSEDSFNVNNYLYIFLYQLRALLRNAYCTCLLTLPFTKFENDHIKKCIHLCDIAVQLQSFTGTKYESMASYKDYHGFFIIQKFAAINGLVAFNPGVTNLAFKLKRKKLIIEEFHLPPELEDSSEREQDDSVVLTCASTPNSKFDF